MPGGGYALPGLLVRLRLSVGPASNGAAGRWHQARSCVYAGWRLRLTRPTYPAPTVCRPGKRSATGRCHQARSRFIAGALTGSHPVGPVSAAPPGDAIRHRAAFMPGGGCALPGLLIRLRLSVGPVSAAPPGDAIRHGAALLPGGGWRLTRPTGASHTITPRRPGKRSATGRYHQARSRFYAGWRLAPYPAYGP